MIKVSANLLGLEKTLFLACSWPTPLHAPLPWPLCECGEQVSGVFCTYKDASLIGSGPHPYDFIEPE